MEEKGMHKVTRLCNGMLTVILCFCLLALLLSASLPHSLHFADWHSLLFRPPGR